MITIEIKADTNDADYITSIVEITESELESIRPLIQKIKDFKPYVTKTQDGEMDWRHRHNFPYGECHREDLGEKNVRQIYGDTRELDFFLEELVPSSNGGIHTIVSIEIYPSVQKEKLL